ncbi:TPR protein [Coccomyxa subellipsoidea C-169]|uniref:TPR protein n=1 Tax=Coccomyxa subellipsoidea (strain C-169) TaxID=574566 RepID=I0YWQ6_COCSC|nr:TPR protein [Coccomyxa subellipsoidea C-169]EIE22825.1 TPR protein [Coccomyxa subellipsoidea C-169]|eukprot:XP_005647369.1 TPR protein [Coccomyxa subellipsoidea C-169]
MNLMYLGSYRKYDSHLIPSMSTHQWQRLKEAELLKKEGNELYAINDIDGAVAKYEEALQKAPEASTKQRAVYYANLAACHLKCRQFEDAVQDSTAALELDPDYVKALMRRSAAYEELDDMEHSLADSQKVIELDPDNTLAKNTVLRLTPVVKERQEKMKDEMLGKLKDLGNTLLGKVGLSLDNFKAEKDPNTGSYSINFSQ